MSSPRRIAAIAVWMLMSAGISRGQDISWIRQFGTPGVDESWGSAADSSGVYVVGNTDRALEGQANAGFADAFVRKYDHAGTVLWTAQFGTPVSDFGMSIDVDDSGVYVVGQTVTGGVFPGQASSGRADVFVRKYSLDGQELWTTQFGTSQTDSPIFGSGIVVHATALFVTGFTRGAFSGETASGDRDVFVTRLDAAAGHVQWVRQFGTPGNDITDTLFGGVAADDTGVYVVANLAFLAPDGKPEFRKYDAAGNLLWRRDFGPDCQYFFLTGVATLDESVFVLGQGLVTPNAPSVECLPPQQGNLNVVGVLIKHDRDGNPMWTRTIEGGSQAGSDHFTGAKGLAAFDSGVYVGGNLTTSFMGHIEEGAHGLDSCNTPHDAFFSKLDAYVRRFDVDGNVIWTRQFGGPNYEVIERVSSGAGGIYAAGETACWIAPGQTFQGFLDAFVGRIEVEPTTPAGRVQLIIGQLETLLSSGRLPLGPYKDLGHTLESAIAALDRGQPDTARAALEEFISDVAALESDGVLLQGNASALTVAATAIAASL